MSIQPGGHGWPRCNSGGSKSKPGAQNAEFWLKLQNFYDLECERRAGKVLEIERQVQPVGAE